MSSIILVAETGSDITKELAAQYGIAMVPMHVNFDDFQPDYTNIFKKSYEIVPVGVNWTDSSHIIGYYNALIDEYELTPTFKLIKKAQKDEGKPYFVILDEMNLSSIDVYFSDFLSAMESGEQIPLYGCTDILKLPKNIFIVGTVNINENQHIISQKVLDRVNVIELDNLNIDDYMSSPDNEFGGNIDYLQSPLSDLNVDLNINHIKETFLKISFNGNNLWSIFTGEFNSLQEILKGSKFDLSFRVINDVLRFMFVAWKYENSPREWGSWQRYFDAQIKQRVISKIFGDKKSLEDILTNLFHACLVNGSNIGSFDVSVVKHDCKYYTSALKIQNMLIELNKTGYVSFMDSL